MRRVPETTLFTILSIILLSIGIRANNIRSSRPLNSSPVINDDTDLVSRLKVDPFRLTIIPPSSGVQFYKDKIVFLSMSRDERKMSPKQISFGTVDTYYASVEDSITGRHMIFSPLSPFSYPCEAMTFSHDYSTMYYTKFPKKDKKEKIFMARFTSNNNSQTGLVMEGVPLDFCTDNFNYSHPTLSSDDKTLIYASDRSGSLGGMDLYLSRKIGDKWSSPENLGIIINTTGNEFFPYLDQENNLFFSSDKLPGFGGYDVFTAKFNGVGWNKPVNLSDHINSKKDEIAFTINKTDGKTAFFTRRETTGEGSMQLFRITLKHEVADSNLLTISYVFNETAVPKTGFTAEGTVKEAKPAEAEPAKSKPDAELLKKEVVKVPAKIKDPRKIPDKETPSKAEPAVTSSKNKTVAAKKTVPVSEQQKDIVIYRIQLLASIHHKSEKEIVINGTSYKLYEYFYLGAYRYTIGEFRTLPPAVELQRICRSSGYQQAFVVAFKNDTRSLDPGLFK